MNILFLSAHLPSPDARQAGQKISYYLCRHFAQRHTLQLLAFSTASELETDSPESAQLFTSRTILPVSAATRLLGVARAPGLPLSVAARYQGRFRRALASLLRSQYFDIVLLDHMAMWQYARYVPATAVRAGIAHDVLSQLWARKAENGRHFAARLETRRLRDWESNAVHNLDLVCVLNSKDSRLILELKNEVPHCVLQPWFSRPSDADISTTTREANSMVFTGAFDRGENVDAVEFAIQELLPQIAIAVPQCTYHLAGFAGDTLSRRVIRHPAVRIEGFVPDLPVFLSGMQIALLPLRLGAGIKTKVLECMAAGVAVVTTPVGVEGIPGRNGVHYLVGRTAEELARHAILLLRNQALRDRIGESAREFIRAGYDFARSARHFEQMLMLRVSQQPPGVKPMPSPVTGTQSDCGAPTRQSFGG